MFVTPSGGVGFRVNLLPPGAQGTVHKYDQSLRMLPITLKIISSTRKLHKFSKPHESIMFIKT